MTADKRLEVGSTYIKESQPTGDGELVGADFRWRIDPVTELRAEMAHSRSSPGGAPQNCDAYLAELTRRDGALDLHAYIREQQPGFGLGQQRSANSALRKAGIDGQYKLNERLSIVAELFEQENLDTTATRQVALAELRFQDASRSLSLGVNNVTDTDPLGADRESLQAQVSSSIKMLADKITLRGSATASQADESLDYPGRTLLGIDYHLSEMVTLFGEYELGTGEAIDTQMTRVGIRATPWNQTQISTTFNHQDSEYGPRTFANLGLVQGWQVNEQWAVDFGLDQSNTLANPAAVPFRDAAPLASGNIGDDFLATYAGALYCSDDWTFNTRLEYRNADSEERIGWFAGFFREPVEGKAFSASTQLFRSDEQTTGRSTQMDVRLGWAYRPSASAWIFPDRLDLIYERRDALGQSVETQRLVNNINANRLINPATQLALQYGAKYVRSNFESFSASGYTDLLGSEYRRQLNRRFDLGLHGSVLHSWRSAVVDYGFGVELGLSMVGNLWLSFGYNFAGFDDEDFSRAQFTAQGPYIRIRMKADQESLKAMLRR